MKKTVLALLLATALLLSLFAGCTSGDGTTSTSAATTTAAAGTTAAGGDSTTAASTKPNFNPTGYPIVNDPITVTCFIVDDGMQGPYEDILYWQELKKLTNITIDFNVVEQDETTINLFFASGDFPDFFMSGLSNDRIQSFGVDGGMFVDISELIPQYMPHMVSRYAEWPQMEKVIRQLNGEVYTIPRKCVLEQQPLMVKCSIVPTIWKHLVWKFLRQLMNFMRCSRHCRNLI